MKNKTMTNLHCSTRCAERLGLLITSDALDEGDVLGGDGDPLRVDGCEVRLCQDTDQEMLAGHLQGLQGQNLPAMVPRAVEE